MKYSAKEMIKNRRSVRTFKGEPLGAAEIQQKKAAWHRSYSMNVTIWQGY